MIVGKRIRPWTERLLICLDISLSLLPKSSLVINRNRKGGELNRIIRIYGEDKLTEDLCFSLAELLEGSKLIVDTLVGSRSLASRYGIQDEVVYDIYDYLNSNASLYKATIEIKDDIDFIASSYIEGKENFTEKDLWRLIEETKTYDHIIIRANQDIMLMDLGQIDNIVVGVGNFPGMTYYITDEKIQERIYSKKNFNLEKALDNYLKGKEYDTSLIGKIKGLFS